MYVHGPSSKAYELSAPMTRGQDRSPQSTSRASFFSGAGAWSGTGTTTTNAHANGTSWVGLSQDIRGNGP